MSFPSAGITDHDKIFLLINEPAAGKLTDEQIRYLTIIPTEIRFINGLSEWKVRLFQSAAIVVFLTLLIFGTHKFKKQLAECTISISVILDLVIVRKCRYFKLFRQQFYLFI